MKTRFPIRHLALLFVGLLSFISTTWAQTIPAEYKIIGSITDSASQKSLTFITLNLMTDKNTVVKIEYTNSDGSFVFSGIKPANYSLVISGVGYKNKTVAVDLTDSTKRIRDLGIITISQETVALKEVTVRAAKPIIKQEVDRISYDTQADPESKAFNVLEMMRKVPFLSLDADGTIRLKGNTDFRILINGKPSSMVERSYKEILRSMPAASIQRIEVITTPPAKYDAEGLAGIINIITNKKIDGGYNGSLTVSERFPVGGPGVGGSVSAQLGRWGMSGFGGASFYQTPPITTTIDRITSGIDPTQLSQNNTAKSSSRNGYLGYEVSYEVDSLNLISAQFNLSGDRPQGSGNQQSVLQGATTIQQRYRLTSNSRGRGNGMDAALNYQLGFKADKNRLLTLSYRYFNSGGNQTNQLAITDRMNYGLPDYRQVNDQDFSEQTIQLDYVYPVRKLTIEAGIKGIRRKNSSDFQYRSYNAETGRFDLDERQSNQFLNTQSVYGIYNSVQYNLKTWTIKGGLRLEQTVMSADFISTESTVSQNYFNVVPSVAISKKFKNNSGLNLGFTQRIQRPGINQLNPFVDRSNPAFERTGNPTLAPQTGGDVQLGYNFSKKVSVNAGLAYGFRNKMIFPVSVYDSTTKITRTTYRNAGRGRLPQLNLSIAYPITKKWNASVNVWAAYAMADGLVNSVPVKNTGFLYNVAISSGYRFEKGWRVNANLSLSGPEIDLQLISNTMVYSSFSVNKEVIKDKLSFDVSLANPFTPFRHYRRKTVGPDFIQTNDRRDYFRTFSVNLNYKFGKLKESIKKNKRSIRNDDLQG